MAGAKNHDFHILPPSPWPLIGAFTALAMAAGGIGWMHDETWGKWVFFLGLAGVLYTFYAWWSDVVREANSGDHTPVVQLHHRYGMIQIGRAAGRGRGWQYGSISGVAA